MSVIQCDHLTRKHERGKALDDVSITMEENTITGLVGRNGAGKTTLLKIMAGIWAQSSGNVQVFGQHPFHNLFVSANTIYIHDEMKFPVVLTLEEILQEAKRFYQNWDETLAHQLMDYFSLDFRQTHTGLSKGKKSTFHAIVGLASRCALTLFDEPTTGMDASVRKDFYRALLKEYLAFPRTIVISSHYADELEDILEDILLIENGSIYFHMSVDELKESVIGLYGKGLDPWLLHKDVIHSESVGLDRQYVVAKNDFTYQEMDQMRRYGVETSTVTLSDLCIYLTERGTGGIDDVFDQRSSG